MIRLKNFITLCFLSAFHYAMAVEPVTVAETSFRVSSNSDKELYYGFASGDEVRFSFQVVDGMSLTELEIAELDGSVKFSDYRLKLLEAKTFTVQQTGVFKFRFVNKSLASRVCKLKIERIPSSLKSRNFNSTVYWKSVQDTLFESGQQVPEWRRDTVAENLIDRVVRIPVKTLLERNANRMCVGFSLPQGTVAWSYYLGVGTSTQKEFNKSQSGFLNSAASTVSRIPGYGSMAALALYGINAFNLIRGEDNVKYCFFTGEGNETSFLAGKDVRGFRQSDVLSDAAQMKKPLNGAISIGLINDNLVDPINVTVSVTAIVVRLQKISHSKKIVRITTRREAYLKLL